MKKNILLIGTSPDPDNRLLLNKENRTDFIERFGPLFKTNDTTTILCWGFKTPMCHTTDTITLGNMDARDFKKFLRDEDIDTSFQGINFPFHDEVIESDYENCIAGITTLTTGHLEIATPRNIEKALANIAKETLKYTITKKPKVNSHSKGLALMMERLHKQMFDHIIVKAEQYAGYIETVFILLPTHYALLLNRQKPEYQFTRLKTGFIPEIEWQNITSNLIVMDIAIKELKTL